jgi:hypothetical protein
LAFDSERKEHAKPVPSLKIHIRREANITAMSGSKIKGMTALYNPSR